MRCYPSTARRGGGEPGQPGSLACRLAAGQQATMRGQDPRSAVTAAGLLSARNSWHRAASSSSPIASAATPS
jgi:hypothetical protein